MMARWSKDDRPPGFFSEVGAGPLTRILITGASVDLKGNP